MNMKHECKQIWDGLVDLAEGRENPQAQAHLSTCSDCTAEFQQLQRILTATQIPTFKAPQHAIEMAMRLMPKRSRQRAVLLGQTFAASAARSGGKDAQLTFDVDGTAIRVMVSEEPSGWSVIGQVPSSDWAVSVGSADVRQDEEGRFQMLLGSLDELIVLSGPTLDVEIPPLAELLDESR